MNIPSNNLRISDDIQFLYLFRAISPNTTPLSFRLALKAVRRTNVVRLCREGTVSP